MSQRRQFLPLLLFCLLSPHITHAFATFIIVFVTHIRVLPTTIIAFSPRIHVSAISVILTLSLRSQVRPHLLYHFFNF